MRISTPADSADVDVCDQWKMGDGDGRHEEMTGKAMGGSGTAGSGRWSRVPRTWAALDPARGRLTASGDPDQKVYTCNFRVRAPEDAGSQPFLIRQPLIQSIQKLNAVLRAVR
jgi:hypothetical protein